MCAALGDGYAVVGSDGRAITGNGYIVESASKKWFIDRDSIIGDLAVGCAGSGRFEMFLRDAFDLVGNDPLIRKSPQILFDKVKDLVRLDGWDFGNEPGPQTVRGTSMVVTKDAIWRVDSDFTVYKVERRYWAIGSGEDYALGAMHYSNRWLTDNTCDLAAVGIEAACEFHAYCGGSWQIEEIR